ncbi:DUF6126 family protein [Streptomyces sp. NPDC046977]|uniref:DUF6126 family protein n=1 Tax=Streptomyces sp. NPDC046977 TaxID=3154703 RepID=UPI0033DB4349
MSFEITYSHNGEPVTGTVAATEVASLVDLGGRARSEDPRPPQPRPAPAPVYGTGHRDLGDYRSQHMSEHGTQEKPERWLERGVALRAFFYIFGTHLFAGFVWLLFYIGGHAHK